MLNVNNKNNYNKFTINTNQINEKNLLPKKIYKFKKKLSYIELMQKLNHKLFIFYFSLILLLIPVLAIYPDPESNAENDTNPIPELFKEVTPDYMNETLINILSVLNGYVFHDILANPPYPYNDSKADLSSIFDEININSNRPFYEFYRDLKKALSAIRDANFDIIAGNISFPSNDTVNLGDYGICLPFQLYLDYEGNQEAEIYIKEYPACSQYYDDETKNFIKDHEKIALDKINGTDPFEFIQDFFNEFYNPKNPDAYFRVKLDFFHDKFLSFTPFSIEQLNYICFQFKDNKTLETKYHVIKGNQQTTKPSSETEPALSKESQKSLLDEGNESVVWDIQSKEGEVKCRVDKENRLNVIFFNKFYLLKEKETEEPEIFKCAELVYSNEYKTIIITQKLADGDIYASHCYTQLLFPKIDVKFNMAMRQTKYSEILFEKDNKKFLDSQTCEPFGSWEDFKKEGPDDYEGVKHYRTKIYNPIERDSIEKMNMFRENLARLGHLKKSTDILILTDTVNFGPASTFIKTIQSNGAAIVASYAGNPKLREEYKKTLDASLDPVDITDYSEIDDFDSLRQKGFKLYKIPFAESFEFVNKSNVIPMAFEVNKPDERTNIYHSYEDIYYKEFIEKAKEIFDKYEESCNPENLNLVKETSQCTFNGEPAHGGFKCGNNGNWNIYECKRSYCDLGYFYNKITDKCEIDHCVVDEIKEINEEQEKIYTIEPNKRYKIVLNTNVYTYFFKSDVEDIFTFADTTKKCSKLCAVKQGVNYMYINYERNLEKEINVTITSKSVNLIVNSIKTDSLKISQILPMTGKIIYMFQITKENYLYVDSFDKSTRFYYAIYQDGMTIDDIININKDYFSDGLDQFLTLGQFDQVYIGIFEQQTFAFTKLYLYDALPEKIEIADGNMPILFLRNDTQLDFSKNTKNIIIRMSEKINATFKIKVNEVTKDIDINDKYFIPENQPFKGIINIYNISSEEEDEMKRGTLIEILYSFDDNEIQVLNGNDINQLIEKKVTLIEYDKNEIDKKTIEIFLDSNAPYKLYSYGGLSKEKYFYYSSNEELSNSLPSLAIKLDDPLRDFQMEENEKYYIALIITKNSQEQNISLTVKYYGHPLEELYEEIDEAYAKNVLSNLTKIIEDNYIFADIVKNPPEPIENYSHPAFDFKEEFEKINTKGRKFYEFYQEIRQVLGKSRDLHLKIYGKKTPSGIRFDYMTACLPFSYYVKKRDQDNEPKIFIKYYPDCGVYYSPEIRKNIQYIENNNIPLELINGEDPFDYIQNIGKKFWGLKSPHAHFTFIKSYIHAFPLTYFPYSPQELELSIKFENIENVYNISYHILKPNFRQMNSLLSSSILSEEGFDEFVQDWRKKHKDYVIEPNIFDMIKEYKKSKQILFSEEGIKEDEKEEEEESHDGTVTWDYQTNEKME